ncbi:MAG: hypothetical protein AMXMBFR84_05820 [Candidatus Hydrogenedentota bacterium]
MRLSGWNITGFVALGIAALFSVVFLWMGFTEDAVRLLVRDTARISVTLFTASFIASSIHTLVQRSWTAWLMQNRRYIGVSFATAHAAHMALLVCLYVKFPHPFREYLDATTLIGGGVAYAVIALMAITSFDRTAGLIGPSAWSALHTFGAYYIWILFAQAYIPRAIRDPLYIPITGMVILSLGVRAAAWRAKRVHTAAERASAT